MPRLQGAVISGAPTPCVRCRQPFAASSVAWTKRGAQGSLCPPCRKTVKAEKKKKKLEGDNA